MLCFYTLFNLCFFTLLMISVCPYIILSSKYFTFMLFIHFILTILFIFMYLHITESGLVVILEFIFTLCTLYL